MKWISGKTIYLYSQENVKKKAQVKEPSASASVGPARALGSGEPCSVTKVAGTQRRIILSEARE
jgi:hypothetical protein